MKTEEATVLAWHFTGPTLRDGSPVPADGVRLTHPDQLRIHMCRSGLHASPKVLDALAYAPGLTLCRVECGGEIYFGDDKLVCRERVILWRINAEALLQKFARKQALSAAHLWQMPSAIRAYLESGDESLRKPAEDAAERVAEFDAARYAAEDAARYAARAAERAVGLAAAARPARYVALYAARDVARAVGLAARMRIRRCMAAAEDAANKMLAEMAEQTHDNLTGKKEV